MVSLSPDAQRAGPLEAGRGASGTSGLSALQRRLPTVDDLRSRSRRRVPKFVFDFVDAGCGDDICLAENRKALDRIKIVPKYGFASVKPRMEVELFGRRYNLPLGISPMGFGGIIWPGTEAALARAAQAAKIPYVLATPACAAIEDIASLAPDVFWFQLYQTPANDFQVALDLVSRADAAGAHVLVITMDVPVRGKRPKDMRNGLANPFRKDLRTFWDIASSPRWAMTTLRAGAPRCRNFLPYAEGDSASLLAKAVEREIKGAFTWEFVRRVRAVWPRALVVKGVLSPVDAQAAIEAGADGVIVSNHGGRVLDAAPAAIDVLERIVSVVDGRAEVLLDSGIRTGLDVTRALARGAKMAMAGRPFLFGLGALGPSGAGHVIDLFDSEIRMALGQLGCADCSAAGRLELAVQV